MKFAYTSDLHLEFFLTSYLKKPTKRKNPLSNPQTSDFPFHRFDESDADVLLLCGDLMPVHQYYHIRPFLEYCSTRFPQGVFIIAGNHEFYYKNVLGTESYQQIKNTIHTIPNVTFLQNETVELENDILLTGATLWTDMDKFNPTVEMAVRQGMNDFVHIIDPNEGCGLTPETWWNEFTESKKYIEKTLTENLNKKHVVMTHHAPSSNSIDPRYSPTNQLNFGYFSDLDEFIMDNQPQLKAWVHGHIHSTMNYTIGNTYIGVNALGYYGVETGPWDKQYQLQTFEV